MDEKAAPPKRGKQHHTKCPTRVARLECSVPGLRWRSGATTAEAEGGSRESRNADPKEQEIATYERDIGKVFDGEVKIGTRLCPDYPNHN